MRKVLLAVLLAAGLSADAVADDVHTFAEAFFRPFISSLYIPDYRQYDIGPGSAADLGVTSLTFINFSPVVQTMHVYQALGGDPQTCSGASTESPSLLNVEFALPPQQTTHLAFPTPLVIKRQAGASCLALQNTTDLQGGEVFVLVNGFTK